MVLRPRSIRHKNPSSTSEVQIFLAFFSIADKGAGRGWIPWSPIVNIVTSSTEWVPWLSLTAALWRPNSYVSPAVEYQQTIYRERRITIGIEDCETVFKIDYRRHVQNRERRGKNDNSILTGREYPCRTLWTIIMTFIYIRIISGTDGLR